MLYTFQPTCKNIFDFSKYFQSKHIGENHLYTVALGFFKDFSDILISVSSSYLFTDMTMGISTLDQKMVTMELWVLKRGPVLMSTFHGTQKDSLAKYVIHVSLLQIR